MKYKNLLHLNESQVKELVKRYYAGENVQRLLDDYSLQVFPSRLYTLLPPMEFTDDGFQCEYCGSNLVAENLSKAAFRDIYCVRIGLLMQSVIVQLASKREKRKLPSAEQRFQKSIPRKHELRIS